MQMVACLNRFHYVGSLVDPPIKPQVSSGSVGSRQAFRIYTLVYLRLEMGYSGIESDLLVHLTEYVEIVTRWVRISLLSSRVYVGVVY